MAGKEKELDPDQVAAAAAKAAEPKTASKPTVEDADPEVVAASVAESSEPESASARGTSVSKADQEAALKKAYKKLEADGYIVRTEVGPTDSSPVSGAYGSFGEVALTDAGTVRAGAQNG